MNKNMFKISYKTTLPKDANSPIVTINTGDGLIYDVKFYEIKNGQKYFLDQKRCMDGQTVNYQYTQTFTEWYITIGYNNHISYEETFNPTGKVVVIKMDAYALGDNIAWIPYVEEFRLKWNCTVICSTFHNDIFKDNYPNIIFIPPNTNMENVYVQYYIGATNEGNLKYSKIKVDENPLQAVAYTTLGLEPREIKPNLTYGLKKREEPTKYVCISEFGSHQKKMWKCDGGWQKIVDYLNSIGYGVVVISKEQTQLQNVINLTGDIPLIERMKTLYDASLFIGVSSGLSWLAWSVNTPVLMISDVTPLFHEFECYRVSANKNLTSVDYETTGVSEVEDVIGRLMKIL